MGDCGRREDGCILRGLGEPTPQAASKGLNCHVIFGRPAVFTDGFPTVHKYFNSGLLTLAESGDKLRLALRYKEC